MKLYRPYISLDVRLRVVLRQLGEMWPDQLINLWRLNKRILLDGKLGRLAALLGCDVRDLHLDHEPALCLRTIDLDGCYHPPANDPAYLIYRSRANHDIKTRVRGDGAQFSDLALLRREKKRNRPPKEKKKWPKRSFPKRRSPMRKSSTASHAK